MAFAVCRPTRLRPQPTQWGHLLTGILARPCGFPSRSTRHIPYRFLTSRQAPFQLPGKRQISTSSSRSADDTRPNWPEGMDPTPRPKLELSDFAKEMLAFFEWVYDPAHIDRWREWKEFAFPTIRKIRRDLDFALSPEVSTLCLKKSHEVFIRARNARLIMSNQIPDMAHDEHKPYCIWYPDLASEDTYRELARRYPDMRYHVGRACAAAGYTSLYKELDLLPEVSIAEEARDNKQGGASIFEHIIRQPVRYKVLNDYTRTANLEDPEAGVHLNGDTAVRSTLSGVVKSNLDPNYEHYFDIQEDGRIGEPSDPSVHQTLEDEHIPLFYSPLPKDLPTTNKDVLIIMAAWEGNIDRYLRLRRPVRIANEISAVIRGIYHHPPFARWIEARLNVLFDRRERKVLRQAIHARFIMCNDLSRIDGEVWGDDLPLVFWWPHFPHENTLRELAWRRPDLKDHVAIACIVANYQEAFDDIRAEPSRRQWEVACQSPNKYYRENVERRAAERDVDLEIPENLEFLRGIPAPWEWRKRYLEFELESSGSGTIPRTLVNTPFVHGDDPAGWEDEWYEPGHLFNDHLQFNVMAWNTYISATDEARKKPGSRYSSEKDFERRRLTSGPYPSSRKNLESHYGPDSTKVGY
ncbi:hypothetical protein LY78DRAFT_650321 [Colletotrichum sublineola]|uniref:Uncharacterized protein n=1 Tax=Colletotrichum sublineola TaxID=1173701 RepID=A0A066X633_COLSU|nr:hypothetical protein LY78DRAFT_650321 [Colletotrichum sublineola]KDN63129.1 hypothetical protein CSUB01_00203 [Colletotrichum sublineola]